MVAGERARPGSCPAFVTDYIRCGMPFGTIVRTIEASSAS